MFEQRLTKRTKHLKKFAKKWPTDAFRVYDRDIPEYPWTVDFYGDHLLLQYFETRTSEGQTETIPDICAELLEIPKKNVHLKVRRRRSGTQHEKLAAKKIEFEVFEDDHKFLVNLDDYIDTGLFLDHRNMRREAARLVKEHPSRNPDVLNLFSYTGAFSVWCAAAGAKVTSVDLSNTYQDWAERNFKLNKLDPSKHLFERSDATRWLPQARVKDAYDLIILDPPTWSRSKRMDTDFDIQRDHVFLLKHCVRLLRPGGTLLFSTNLTSFKLDKENSPIELEETTQWSVPEDFRSGIHRSFKGTK